MVKKIKTDTSSKSLPSKYLEYPNIENASIARPKSTTNLEYLRKHHHFEPPTSEQSDSTIDTNDDSSMEEGEGISSYNSSTTGKRVRRFIELLIKRFDPNKYSENEAAYKRIGYEDKYERRFIHQERFRRLDLLYSSVNTSFEKCIPSLGMLEPAERKKLQPTFIQLINDAKTAKEKAVKMSNEYNRTTEAYDSERYYKESIDKISELVRYVHKTALEKAQKRYNIAIMKIDRYYEDYTDLKFIEEAQFEEDDIDNLVREDYRPRYKQCFIKASNELQALERLTDPEKASDRFKEVEKNTEAYYRVVLALEDVVNNLDYPQST